MHNYNELTPEMIKMANATYCGIIIYKVYSAEENRFFVEFANNEACNITGYNIDEMNQKHIGLADLTLAEDKREILRIMRDLREEGEARGFQLRCINAHGRKFSILGSAVIVGCAEDENGVYKRAQFTFTDNSENVRLLDELEFERTQYRDAIQHASYFSFTIDLTDGYMRKDFLRGKDIWALKNLGLRVPVKYDDMVRTYDDIRGIVHLSGNDKELTRHALLSCFESGRREVDAEEYSQEYDRYYRVSVYLTENEQNGHVQGLLISRDITKQKLAEIENKAKLEKALDEAERANMAKSAFLARVSHDIRTPLNGIIGILEINEAHADNLELVSQNRKKAKVASNHLLQLINDVLEMSKLESGETIFSNEPFNIAELAGEVLVISEIRAKEAGVTLGWGDYNVDLQAPYVMGSPLHLRQIFVNILSNAIKYNRQGGTVFCKAWGKMIDDNTILYSCSVKDTGIGMSKEFIEHIYEPFSQERIDARSVFQGTGLGMSIVKSLVEKMNGHIEIESEEGVGSNITVTIPFRTAKREDVLIADKGDGTTDISGMKILLVEDNELNMEIATFLLEDAGAIVKKAVNGYEAVEIFNMSSPDDIDVILMDLMMPVMNGIDATVKIRSMDKPNAMTIPIIAMTANAFMEDVQQVRAAGMNGHLPKPIEPEKVFRTIAKYRKHTQE